jgi:hypothetical protein
VNKLLKVRNTGDLLGSVSFANYLTVVMPYIDALRLIEAWDYLSGVFLMILQNNFPEENEFLIVAAPIICSALEKLLAIPGVTCKVSDTTMLSIYRLCRSSGYREFTLDEEPCRAIADGLGRRT